MDFYMKGINTKMIEKISIHKIIWRRLGLLTLFGLIVLGLLFTRYTWISSMNKTSEQALKSANIAEISLNGEMIRTLSGVQDDEGTVAYNSIKERLMDLTKIEKDIRFAYIYTQRDGKLYFIADSEPAYSKDYSPPGQEYSEASAEYKNLLQMGPLILQNLLQIAGALGLVF
jgi:hypothetical protein